MNSQRGDAAALTELLSCNKAIISSKLRLIIYLPEPELLLWI